MPGSVGPLSLSRVEDAAWITSAGLPVTDAQLATLQALIDRDDEAARVGFFRTVFGKVAESRQAQAAFRHLPTIVRNVRTLSAIGLDATKVIQQHPAALHYGVDAICSKVQLLALLGLQPEVVINRLPATLGYSPESVVEKMANLQMLGLDGPRIVNELPAVIGSAPEKVLLTTVLFREMGIWETVQTDWNNGRNLSLLITPVESLALMAGLEPDRFREKPTRAKRFAEVRGWNSTPARTGELRARITPGTDAYNPQFVRNLGMFTPFYVGRTTGLPPFAIATLCAPQR